MPFASALSTLPDTTKAIEDVCQRALAKLGTSPDLAFLFFSPHHTEAADELSATARQLLQPRCFLGCDGESIVGGDKEIEQAPALSLWLGRWSQPIEIEPFHLALERTPEGHNLLGWPDSILSADPKQSAMLLVGDPMTFPVDMFLKRINEDHPSLRVMGGMASGGRADGQCRLLLNDTVANGGAVGVLMQGPIRLRSIVSQGCRPIGRPLVITKGEQNVIAELGGKSALMQLQELWQELSPRDRELFQEGLHIGLVINEYQDQFQRGDFLVRNVMGLDRATGVLIVTDRIRVGQTIQFHVRDAATADEDLHALLQLDVSAHERPAGGALAFTCNGRGTRLFDQPHHDARVISAELGNIPLAGFFAAGELGPVGGQNFIHGFTASVVVFEE